MKFKKQTIAVVYTPAAEGVAHIPAYMCGPVAYHRGLWDDSTWTVTHVPSGYAVRAELQYMREARELAELVHPLLPTEGTTGVVPPPESYSEAPRAVAEWLAGRVHRITIVVGVDPPEDDPTEEGGVTGWDDTMDLRAAR